MGNSHFYAVVESVRSVGLPYLAVGTPMHRLEQASEYMLAPKWLQN
jgi:hypothetical protein